jgi:hypothetical protein
MNLFSCQQFQHQVKALSNTIHLGGGIIPNEEEDMKTIYGIALYGFSEI